MPIYEYRCADCGVSKDHLQKVSDAPIDTCPACGSKAYSKALTAAGFQLKGSGWYATDFKGGGSGNTTKTEEKSSASTTESSSAGGACNPGCACH
ncbi:zinc ribbon domain-containing protein [Viridibacterium curvum]|uniref:Putative regulatory protein FmdB zinc ribbon domain-containing protein n=1 Tax=Viridibacterium curvum TaxID=1101404 RepID=A0ABP9QBM9_9RHOO